MVKIEGSWRDVKNACRTTVGKRHTEKDATERFKRDLVIAEHTPIRKRLCYQATPEARAYALRLKWELSQIAPEIADALVPNCVYRCGCPEMQGTGCGWWDAFIKDKAPERLLSIRERYAMYDAGVMRLMSLGRAVQERRKVQKEADI